MKLAITNAISSLFAIFLIAATPVAGSPQPDSSIITGRAFTATTPTFVGGSWIWSDNLFPNGSAPASSSAFRVAIQPAISLPLVNISIAIAADNAYNLYFNGTFVGNGLDAFETPDEWTILNVAGDVGPFIFAVLATNYDTPGPGPAGIIANFQFSNNALGDTYSWWTGDAGWVAVPVVPNLFQDPDFDDSAWPVAVNEGAYGVGPWGILPALTQRTTCA